MKKYLAIALMTAALTANAATPTFAQIEQAMAEKKYNEANVMMMEVLKKRPESIKAHTLNASLILASGGSKEAAEASLAYANKLKGVTNALVEPVVISKPDNTAFKVFLGATSIILLGMFFYLVRMYVNITKKKEDDIEDDKANYSTELTSHAIRLEK